VLFERKGNIVSALRARRLAERLRSTPATSKRERRSKPTGFRGDGGAGIT